MNSIPLPGLSAEHPAACLGTYGLATVLDSSFSFTGKKGHAVIHGPFKDVNEIVARLNDREAWARFVPIEAIEGLYAPPKAKAKKPGGKDKPPGNPEKDKKPKGKKKEEQPDPTTTDVRKISLARFREVAATCPEWAFAIATDHVLAPPEVDTEAGEEADEAEDAEGEEADDKKGKREKVKLPLPKKTLFHPNNRGRRFPPYFHLWRNALMAGGGGGSGERIRKILTDSCWAYDEGESFMLFPELPVDVQFRVGGNATVPLLNLLALCHWRNCPVFRERAAVGVPGWVSAREDGKTVYSIVCPIPEEPTSVRTLMSWLLNADLLRGGTPAGHGCPATVRFPLRPATGRLGQYVSNFCYPDHEPAAR